MSATYKSLQELASETAAEIEQEARALQPERLKIQARLQEIERITNSARFALQRLVNYRTDIGGERQCPRCWVRDEVRSPMPAIGRSETDDHPPTFDGFRCRNCRLEVWLAP